MSQSKYIPESDLQRKQRCPKAQGQLWKRWQASTLRWKKNRKVDFLARSLIQVPLKHKCLSLLFAPLLIVLNKPSKRSFLFWLFKELFAELDKEEDGVVYTKNLIVQLRALNVDMDKNLKVDEKFDESISFQHLFMKLQKKNNTWPSKLLICPEMFTFVAFFEISESICQYQ